MEQYKKDFIDLLLRTGALKFGEFTLKSGRVSPYFINMGDFSDGETISKLSYYYASKIMDSVGEDSFDTIFGPAYKGIQLAVGTCYSLYKDFGIKKSFSHNRKESKEYGYDQDGKVNKASKHIVGAAIKPGDRLIIIDDVFTSGKAKYETIELIKSIEKSVSFRAVLFAVDRQETTTGDMSAVELFSRETHIPCLSIINVSDILEYVFPTGQLKGETLDKTIRYLEQYGTKSIKEKLGQFRE